MEAARGIATIRLALSGSAAEIDAFVGGPPAGPPTGGRGGFADVDEALGMFGLQEM